MFSIRQVRFTAERKSNQPSVTSTPVFSFIYLTGGELTIQSDGNCFNCFPGQILLIPQNKGYSFTDINEAIGYIGSFSLSILPDVNSVITLRKPYLKVFWFDEAIFVNELLKMMTRAYRSKRETLVSKELDLLLTMVGVADEGIANPLVTGFLKAIHDDSRPIRFADDYANECGVSLNWLNRVVRRESGNSVSSWIDQARISRAKSLLKDTEMPIIDIAVAVGLDDQSYFARFFKRHCGTTPSEYRSSTVNKHGKS